MRGEQKLLQQLEFSFIWYLACLLSRISALKFRSLSRPRRLWLPALTASIRRLMEASATSSAPNSRPKLTSSWNRRPSKPSKRFLCHSKDNGRREEAEGLSSFSSPLPSSLYRSPFVRLSLHSSFSSLPSYLFIFLSLPFLFPSAPPM